MTNRTVERPIGVTLTAVLLGSSGVVALLAVLGILGEAPAGVIGTILGVLFGLAMLYLAYGLLTLQSWAWLTTLLVAGIYALFAVFTLFTAPEALGVWISLIVAVAIIAYVVRPEVRDVFSPRAPSR